MGIRAELTMLERALRNDWPIPQDVKNRCLQIALNIADPVIDDVQDADAAGDGEADGAIAELPAEIPARTSYRTRLAALRVVAMYSKLSLEQQRLDLLRDKLDGNSKGFVLADAVSDAEAAEASYTPDVKPE